MFKLLLTVVFCVAATMTTVQTAPAKPDLSKYDNVDIDTVLNNDRLVNTYFMCLMDTGKCSPQADEVKQYISEALGNKCADCTKKQREAAEKIIKFLSEKKNDMWKQLETKYDPQGTYRQSYAEDAKKLNIAI